MAEQILKAKLKKEGIENVKVSSAGICVYPEGCYIDEKAVNALKKYNIPVRRKKARQLTEKMVKEADYVFTMTKNQKEKINSKNVYTLDDFTGSGDIADPFMQSQEVYDKTAFALILCINILFAKLFKTNTETESAE